MLYAPGTRGQGLVEYALIIGFVALLIIAFVVGVGDVLNVMYSRVAAQVPR